MPLKQITKEIGEVIGVNTAILSVTTFTNLEVLLKIRKLNSNNPKYKPEVKRDDKVLRKFIKEVKGVKIYATYSI